MPDLAGIGGVLFNGVEAVLAFSCPFEIKDSNETSAIQEVLRFFKAYFSGHLLLESDSLVAVVGCQSRETPCGSIATY